MQIAGQSSRKVVGGNNINKKANDEIFVWKTP